MSKLSELFKSVSEPNLTKSELENYHTQLSALFAQIMLESAELTKKEALFFLESILETDAAKKRAFNGSIEGLRLIELKAYAKGCEKLLSSLKSRLFSTY